MSSLRIGHGRTSAKPNADQPSRSRGVGASKETNTPPYDRNVNVKRKIRAKHSEQVSSNILGLRIESLANKAMKPVPLPRRQLEPSR